MNETCEAKEESMKKYLSKVKHYISAFTKVKFIQVPREENMEVDSLSKVAFADSIMDIKVEV